MRAILARCGTRQMPRPPQLQVPLSSCTRALTRALILRAAHAQVAAACAALYEAASICSKYLCTAKLADEAWSAAAAAGPAVDAGDVEWAAVGEDADDEDDEATLDEEAALDAATGRDVKVQ